MMGEEAQVKRGRGRPKKVKTPEELAAELSVVKRGRGRPKKEVAQESNTDENNEVAIETDSNEDKKLTPKKRELKDYYDSVKHMANKFFQIKPLEGKFRCIMCQSKKSHSDFFRSYSLLDLGSINELGERHLPICKKCSKKLFNFLYEEYDQDLPKVINHWCQILNIYYSNEIFERMMTLHNSRKGTDMEYKFDIVTDYITALGRAGYIDATYWDSPYLQDNIKNGIQIDMSIYNTDQDLEKEYPEEFEKWNKEDLYDYDNVLDRCKYDPFIDEDTEDRRKLYHSFVGFSDEEIGEDSGKLNACIDMCRSILRLEKLNKRRARMEKDDSIQVKELKQMAELQASERKSIQQYQKDWGFNKRFDLNKSQGSGTLTGIMKEMDDGMFEDALLNAYDIKTSNAMVSAAEASWKAIFGQLNISESEFAKIVSDQRDVIMKLRSELDETKEKLRKANIIIKKDELENQAKLMNL